jgi:hypothetical protein
MCDERVGSHCTHSVFNVAPDGWRVKEKADRVARNFSLCAWKLENFHAA